jgi:hypothetical protein
MAVGRCDVLGCDNPAPYCAGTTLRATIPVDDVLSAFVRHGPVIWLCRQHAAIAAEKAHVTVTSANERGRENGRI